MPTAVRSRLFSEKIEVVTVIEMVGADGRTSRTESSTQVRGAFRQRAAIDSQNAGIVVTDELVAYLHPDVAVKVGDALVVRGERYEVVSTAFPQVALRSGRVHHAEVRVRRSSR